jgi:hypothetical protein
VSMYVLVCLFGLTSRPHGQRKGLDLG